MTDVTILAESPRGKLAYDPSLNTVYALTPCCGASGKGHEVGVVCRKCYQTVDLVFGDCAVPGDPGADWDLSYMLWYLDLKDREDEIVARLNEALGQRTRLIRSQTKEAPMKFGRKPKYRFVGRSGPWLIWEAPIPGDSRVDQVRVGAEWFYRTMVKS